MKTWHVIGVIAYVAAGAFFTFAGALAGSGTGKALLDGAIWPITLTRNALRK